MENLIKALQIFLKYKNLEYPTACDREVIYVVGIHPDHVSKEDIKELESLGFDVDVKNEIFYSYKYGSI